MENTGQSIRVFIGKVFFLFFCLSQPVLPAEEILTWEDCVLEAKQHHPDLLSAAEQCKEAKLDVDSAESGLYPQVNTSLSVSNGRSSGQSSQTSYSAGVSGSQLVYDGNKTKNEREKSFAGYTYQRAQYDVISSQIRLRLRSAFVQFLQAVEWIAMTKEITRRRKQNLELVQLRYEAGREHKGSLLSAKASLEQSEYEYRQALRNARIVQLRLSAEMGRPLNQSIQIKEDDGIYPEYKDQPDFEGLLEKIPLMRAWLAQKEAARLGVQLKQANYKPKVSASVSASMRDTDWPIEENQWSAGLQVSYSLFDGGARKANLEKARSQLTRVDEDIRSERNTLLVKLEDSWASLKDAVENVLVQNQFLEAAKERAEITQAQYSNGLVSFDNWTLIEDDWVRTKKACLNARTQALLSEAAWIEATGGTLDEI
ncbi:MAG: TolC family protein [Candidatus Aureabacteria bacterium]|nr:TolC family protein [Candidatus Auribacterota bacterium]